MTIADIKRMFLPGADFYSGFRRRDGAPNTEEFNVQASPPKRVGEILFRPSGAGSNLHVHPGLALWAALHPSEPKPGSLGTPPCAAAQLANTRAGLRHR